MRAPLALCCAALLAFAAVIGSPAAARADACGNRPRLVPENIFVSPDVVPVGVRHTQYAYLTVAILDPCSRIDAVTVTLDDPSSEQTLDVPELPDFVGAAARVPPAEGLGRATVPDQDGYRYWGLDLALVPAALFSGEAGRWETRFLAHDNDPAPDTTAVGPTFAVVREARLTTNAFPEPVRKGARITVDGMLERANWEQAAYLPHRDRTLELQFRTPGGPYTTLKTLVTGHDGRVRGSVTATRDGCYRYVFRGTSTTHAVKAAGDCVEVS